MPERNSGAGRRRRGGRLRELVSVLCIPFLPLGAVIALSAPTDAAVWFARAKGTGDGSSPMSPIGSTAGLEAVSKPGDLLILLASDAPLDGGLALQPGQTLIGHAEAGRKPVITNSGADRNGGSGIVLADDCKVLDVQVRGTRASGAIGMNVNGACLLGVDIEDANQSAGFTTTEVGLLGKVSHAGILFLSDQPEKRAENRIQRCQVRKATGIGIGEFALKGSKARLILSQVHVEGGGSMPPLYDMGVLAFAEGKASESVLEVTDSTVKGRLSQQGRNILAFAAADARVRARVERSVSGESGQDGVIGVASRVPATVELEIRDSTLEKAAQMNLEGTILDLPASDPGRAHESLVSIDVQRCLIRDVGFVDGFREEAQNIWIAPSVLAKGPFARGRYRLSIRDSIVEKGLKGGINIGNDGTDFRIAPDEGEYEVELRGNTIRENGPAEVIVAAAKARIDARRNFWGTPAGLPDGRLIVRDQARRSQFDGSDPLSRPSERIQTR